MSKPKRVLCIMDHSSVGRSSLGVVSPVLSACGVQACMLPTALFSTHTGGFGRVRRRDEAIFGMGALQHFMAQEIDFDAIYVGYLCSEAQFALAGDALSCWPRALHLVDPALGDNGKAYSGISDDMARHMRLLCTGADIITPNFTESALLIGDEPSAQPISDAELAKRMERLCAGRSVVVTSVPREGEELSVCGSEADGERPFSFTVPRIAQSYPGTGDLFAAALCGLLLREKPLAKAAEVAAQFVTAAVKSTFEGEGEVRHGVWFEQHLHLLWQEVSE